MKKCNSIDKYQQIQALGGVGHPNLLSPKRVYLFPMCSTLSLRVEFLLKTDGGYLKDSGVTTNWKILGISFATTPIVHLHQSPPSPTSGDQEPSIANPVTPVRLSALTYEDAPTRARR